MKYSNDTIGNRTHEPPAGSAVPQLNVPPRTPPQYLPIDKQTVAYIQMLHNLVSGLNIFTVVK